MTRRLFIASWMLTAMLGQQIGAVHAAEAPATIALRPSDRDVAALSMNPPAYPRNEAWYGVSGDTVLILTIDSAGMITEVMVEKPSGSLGLDKAAVEGAHKWRFAPAIVGGVPSAARVRVPVQFVIPKGYSVGRITGRPRDTYFEARRSGQAHAPAFSTTGELPAFVPDEYPVGIESVADAIALLEAHAYREPDPIDGIVREYTLADEEGISYWNVVVAGPGAPSVVRRRLVNDGSKGWFVSSWRCEADQSGCSALELMLRETADQPALPPPPPLPPLPEGR